MWGHGVEGVSLRDTVAALQSLMGQTGCARHNYSHPDRTNSGAAWQLAGPDEAVQDLAGLGPTN